ncbi:MAG: M3 family oligoendopeptidase [Acidimicrobiia bacterium]
MTKVEDVAWDVSDLVEPLGGLEKVIEQSESIAKDLESFEGKIAELSVGDFLSLMKTYGDLHETLGRAANYTGLMFSVNTQDEDIASKMQKVEEISADISARLSFIEVEFNELDDQKAQAIINDEKAAFCRYYLIHLRRVAQYQLSTKEEALMTQLSVTGASAWDRLFEDLCSVITVDIESNDQKIQLDGALANLHSPNRNLRAKTRDAVTKSLKEGLKTRAYIYNTLAADHALEDKLRGYPTWISARNLDNDTTDESVESLVQSCVSRYDIAHRWYKLKAKLLKLDKLEDYDRYAPLSQHESSIDFDQATHIVRDAYNSFSPKMTNIFDMFMENKWIDAPVRDGKRGGAFCAYTVSGHHPYVMLNWTNNRNDVLTLAHELGHACHAYLAKDQGPFHQDTGLTFCETASVFAESVTFNRLLDSVEAKSDRLDLLAAYIDGQIATVFRQIAMHNFETAVHSHRRNVGELKLEDFSNYWLNTQRDMLGEYVNVSEQYGVWWSYVPHFISTPGYVYAYAYGQLLALSVYAQYKKNGQSMVNDYENMLSAGGSKSPQDLASMVGVNLSDPNFWNSGLEIISKMVDQAEELAN